MLLKGNNKGKKSGENLPKSMDDSEKDALETLEKKYR